jgi:hypothetical protein
MSFNLEIHTLGIGLELVDQVVNARLGFVGQRR